MTEGDNIQAIENRKLGSDFDREASKAFLPPPEKVAEKTHGFELSIDPVTPHATEADDWSDSDDDADLELKKSDIVSTVVITFQQSTKKVYFLLTKATKGYLVSVVFLIAFFVYFIIAMNYEFGSESSVRLLVCTILGVLIITRRHVFMACKIAFKKVYGSDTLSPIHQRRLYIVRFAIRWFLYAVLAGVTIWALVDQGKKDVVNLRSLPGLFLFLVLCMLMSTHPAKINWHTIYWSFELQFLAALFVLKWKFGKEMILWIQSRLDEFFANSNESSKLLFGETYRDHYMVFGALPLVFLTNATLTVLYYLGAMQFIIEVIGTFLSFVLDTSPVESMSVAAGIFLEGITAILTLRPFLHVMTKSQLFLIITSVFASLGGAYLAILSSLGVSLEYLIPAMLVSAPATFAVCKLMVPESRDKEGHSIMDNLELADEERRLA